MARQAAISEFQIVGTHRTHPNNHSAPKTIASLQKQQHRDFRAAVMFLLKMLFDEEIAQLSTVRKHYFTTTLVVWLPWRTT